MSETADKPGPSDENRLGNDTDIFESIDYIIECNLDVKGCTKLIRKLYSVGLDASFKILNDSTIFILIICPEEVLFERIKSKRALKYLFNLYKSVEDSSMSEVNQVNEQINPAERLQEINKILTGSQSDQGCALTPGIGEWSFVRSFYPINDWSFNKNLLSSWKRKWFFNSADLDLIRANFGEKIAYYFIFQQFFFKGLTVASIFGIIAQFSYPKLSLIFIFSMCLWSIIFIESWKYKEKILAKTWGVIHYQKLEHERVEFSADHVERHFLLGDTIRQTSYWKQMVRFLLNVPLLIFGVSAFFIAISTIYLIDIFLSDIYDGPSKSIFSYTPSVLFLTVLPILNYIYDSLSKAITKIENHRTEFSYVSSLSKKRFVSIFLKSYLSLLLTLFGYNIFGDRVIGNLGSRLSKYRVVTKISKKRFRIDYSRLRKMVMSVAVQGQLIGIIMGTVFPAIKPFIYKMMQIKTDSTKIDDEMLAKIYTESKLLSFDVDSQIAQMVTQFGFVTMFSPLWPLATLTQLIDSFINLRTDAIKICTSVKRPVPEVEDSIYPWTNILQVLSWMASLTVSSVYSLYSGKAKSPVLQSVLVAVTIAEHLYFSLKLGISHYFKSLTKKNKLEDSQLELDLRVSMLKKDPLQSEMLNNLQKSQFISEKLNIKQDQILEQLKNHKRKGHIKND